jgi:large conductance mechanosensitive channel
MLKEFREFLLRGNIVDLAVAFIAGVAFSAVVNSLVSDVIMQVVAAIVGKPDFSSLSFTLHGSEIRWGAFLTVLLNFVLTMGAVFFFLVKPINAMTARFAPPSDGAPSVRECTECLGEVPAKARRCQFCTSELAPLA